MKYITLLLTTLILFGCETGTDDPAPPSVPGANYTIELSSTTSTVTVSWSTTEDADYFRLLAATSEDGSYDEIYAGSANSYEYTGLTAGTSYYYRLQVCSDSSSSNCSGMSDGEVKSISTITDTIKALTSPASINVLVANSSDDQGKGFGQLLPAFDDSDTDYSNLQTEVINITSLYNAGEITGIDLYLCMFRYASGALANDDGYDFRVDLQQCDLSTLDYIEGVATASRIDENSEQNYTFYFEVFSPEDVSAGTTVTDTSTLDYTVRGSIVAEMDIIVEANETDKFGEFDLVMEANVIVGGQTELVTLSIKANDGEVGYNQSGDKTIDVVATLNVAEDSGEIYFKFEEGEEVEEAFSSFNATHVVTKRQDEDLNCWARVNPNPVVLEYVLFSADTGVRINNDEVTPLMFEGRDNNGNTAVVSTNWLGFGENGYLSVAIVADGTANFETEYTFDSGTVDSNDMFVLKQSVLLNDEVSAPVADCAALNVDVSKTIPTYKTLSTSYTDRPELDDGVNYIYNGSVRDQE